MGRTPVIAYLKPWFNNKLRLDIPNVYMSIGTNAQIIRTIRILEGKYYLVFTDDQSIAWFEYLKEYEAAPDATAEYDAVVLDD